MIGGFHDPYRMIFGWWEAPAPVLPPQRSDEIDLSQDIFILDGLTDITLNGVTVHNAYPMPCITKEAASSEAAYLHQNTEFHLPTDPEQSPQVGDVVVWDGVSFNVLEVRKPFNGDYWGLTCRGLAITDDATLADLVTLYPAVRSILPGGSTKTTHTTASASFTDVRCKIQLQPASIEDRAGKREFVEIYKVYLSQDITDDTIAAGDVFKDQDGNVYKIISWDNRQAIDDFTSVVCEVPRAG